MRKVTEWVGLTDDAQVPPRVKLRLWDKYCGNCTKCLSKIVGKLRPEYDHVVALANGGENREGNLALVCSECHKVKTKLDVAEKSHMYHKRLKTIGIRKKRRTIPGRRFNGEPRPSRWK